MDQLARIVKSLGAARLYAIVLWCFVFNTLLVPALCAQEPAIPPEPDPSLSDSAYLNDYYEWVWNYYLYSKPDSALLLGERLERIARERGVETFVGRAYSLQAASHWVLGETGQAATFFRKSIAVYESINDLGSVSEESTNLGIVLADAGEYDSALKAFDKSLRMEKDLPQTSSLGNLYNGIGRVHLSRGDLPKALDAFRQSIRSAEAHADSAGLAYAEGNIGNVYTTQKEMPKARAAFMRLVEILEHMPGQDLQLAVGYMNVGSTYAEEGDSTNGNAWMRRAIALHKRIGDRQGEALAIMSLGSQYGKYGMHDRALTLYDEALRLYGDGEDPGKVCQLCTAKATALYELGRTELAVEHAVKGLELARKAEQISFERDAVEVLFKCYQRLGKWQQAMDMHLLFTQLKDSLVGEDNQRAVIGHEFQWKYEKQALSDSLQFTVREAVSAKEVQKQKYMRNGFMGGFGLVALFAIVFFTQRNRISKEKARSEELLLNILPEEVAQELKDKGEADAKLIDEATILFTDFKGFTSISEKLSAKELVEELNVCFKAFDHIITTHGIEKIKTIGDAYMCAGGLSHPKSSGPTEVVLAALEMQAFMQQRKTERTTQQLPAFEMRVGIHTGPVVAGIVGVKKFQYDIWGDTVNIASRMESSGEVGHVNISDVTYALVKDVVEDHVASTHRVDPTSGIVYRPAFTFTSRGRIQAKGKGEMEMWFVDRMVASEESGG